MNERRKTRLTPEEQELKERLMRKNSVSEGIQRGSGRVPEDFWDLPWPEDSDGLLLKALLEDRREGR